MESLEGRTKRGIQFISVVRNDESTKTYSERCSVKMFQCIEIVLVCNIKINNNGLYFFRFVAHIFIEPKKFL